MTFTSHGHHIEGSRPTPNRPLRVARCGGPKLCAVCSIQAGNLPGRRHQPSRQEMENYAMPSEFGEMGDSPQEQEW